MPLVIHRSAPLANPTAWPLYPAGTARQFGPTLVVAPHQDDETLGCGGAIALLRRAGVPVSVLFVSDGTGSHPNSPSYPPERLRATREAEAREALHILGVAPDATTFLRLPDTAVPTAGATGFTAAAGHIRAILGRTAPKTILLPWRRDPHRDHQATGQLVRAALAGQARQPRLLEYPIWLWELATDDDQPLPGEVITWRLDVRAVLPLKEAAIGAHRSQTTDLITDDPAGFRLLPQVLAHFTHPWEIFLEGQEGFRMQDQATFSR